MKWGSGKPLLYSVSLSDFGLSFDWTLDSDNLTSVKERIYSTLKSTKVAEFVETNPQMFKFLWF